MSVDTSSGGGKGGRKSVDAHINLVPFIDLMSVLIAFLLITAVWTNIAQMNVTPKGQGAQGEPPPPGEAPPVFVSVLIGPNDIKVGMSDQAPGAFTPIKRKSGTVEGEWDPADGAFGELLTLLEGFRNKPEFSSKFVASNGAPRTDIEVAADKGVQYQGIITTMDTAIRAGWIDVGFIPPASLSARVTE